MTVMIALLRGINVGGSKRLAMADLRRVVEGCGFTDVQTYVQSGNVVLSTTLRSTRAVSALLHDALAAEVGMDVAVVVRTRAELRAVISHNPFADLDPGPTQLHVVFMPGTEQATLPAIDLERFAPETATVVGRELYLYVPDGLGRSKLAVALARTTGHGTARNWRTVTSLAEFANMS